MNLIANKKVESSVKKQFRELQHCTMLVSICTRSQMLEAASHISRPLEE